MVLGMNRSMNVGKNSTKVATEAAAKPKIVFGSFGEPYSGGLVCQSLSKFGSATKGGDLAFQRDPSDVTNF